MMLAAEAQHDIVTVFCLCYFDKKYLVSYGLTLEEIVLECVSLLLTLSINNFTFIIINFTRVKKSELNLRIIKVKGKIIVYFMPI